MPTWYYVIVAITIMLWIECLIWTVQRHRKLKHDRNIDRIRSWT